jgi:N-acetylmuramoyl-L-alanine amidase
MIISYDFGHTANGGDTSANGIVYEYAEIRKYAPIAIQVLEQAGHKCINCTPTQSGISLNDSLAYRVNHANASGSQLHLCFHVNAFDGSGHGSEIEIASDSGQKYAESVLNEICVLGFTRRGINRPSLYVTRHTNMTALLVEPFFCDSPIDCKIYNAEKLGNAIAKGVLNVIGGEYKPSNNVQPTPNPIPQPSSNTWGGYNMDKVRKVQNLVNGLGIAHIDTDGKLGSASLSAFKKLPVAKYNNYHNDAETDVICQLLAIPTPQGYYYNRYVEGKVIEIQKAHGLSADGEVGINTLLELLK